MPWSNFTFNCSQLLSSLRTTDHDEGAILAALLIAAYSHYTPIVRVRHPQRNSLWRAASLRAISLPHSGATHPTVGVCRVHTVPARHRASSGGRHVATSDDEQTREDAGDAFPAVTHRLRALAHITKEPSACPGAAAGNRREI